MSRSTEKGVNTTLTILLLALGAACQHMKEGKIARGAHRRGVPRKGSELVQQVTALYGGLKGIIVLESLYIYIYICIDRYAEPQLLGAPLCCLTLTLCCCTIAFRAIAVRLLSSLQTSTCTQRDCTGAFWHAGVALMLATTTKVDAIRQAGLITVPHKIANETRRLPLCRYFCPSGVQHFMRRPRICSTSVPRAAYREERLSVLQPCSLCDVRCLTGNERAELELVRTRSCQPVWT